MQIIKNLYVSKKTICRERNRVKLVKLHTHEYWWSIPSMKKILAYEREKERERMGRILTCNVCINSTNADGDIVSVELLRSRVFFTSYVSVHYTFRYKVYCFKSSIDPLTRVNLFSSFISWNKWYHTDRRLARQVIAHTAIIIAVYVWYTHIIYILFI